MLLLLQVKNLIEAIELAITICRLAKTNLQGNILPQHAVTLDVEHHIVQRTLAIAPLEVVGVVDVGLEREGVDRATLNLNLVDAILHEFSLRIVYIEAHLNLLGKIKIVGHNHIQLKFCILACGIWLKQDIEITHSQTTLRKEIAILKLRKIHLEDILLQLRRATVTHSEHYLIHALTHIGREQKIRRGNGILNLSNRLIVDKESEGHTYILQMQVEVIVVHRGVDLHLLHITNLATGNGYALGLEIGITSCLGAAVSHRILAFVVGQKLRAIDSGILSLGSNYRTQGHAQKDKLFHKSAYKKLVVSNDLALDGTKYRLQRYFFFDK